MKAINLKQDDFVVGSIVLERNEDASITIITQRGSAKRMKVNELSKLGRAKRGLMVLRELKSNPHRVFKVIKNEENQVVELVTETNHVVTVDLNEIPINDRQSNGSFVIDEKSAGGISNVIVKFIPDQDE